MSHHASRYAAEMCKAHPNLSTRARFVFVVMAATANYETGHAYSGAHLVAVTGYDSSIVRRAIREVVAAGLIGVDLVRSGRATRYRFPVVGDAVNVAAISTTRARVPGSTRQIEHLRGHTGSTGGHTGSTGGHRGPRIASGTGYVQEWCDTDCEHCSGLQWETQTPDRPYAVPCRNRPERVAVL